MKAHAGQVYRSGKGRHLRVEQVRQSGGGGIAYALARRCGPGGKCHGHPILGEVPITIYLTPDGSLPTGYELLDHES